MPKENKNQDFAINFRKAPEHLNRLLAVNNLELLTLYDEKRGIYPVGPNAAQDFLLYLLRYITGLAESKNITMAVTRDVEEQVRLNCKKRVDSVASKYLALKDCLLNIETFEYEEFGLDRICFFPVPYSKDEITAAPTPAKFLKFLREVIIHENPEDKPKQNQPDEETIAVVQEMFGVCLIPHTRAEASFFLVGDGSNGKSVLLDILEEIIGRDFVSAKSIESLTTNRFASAGLVGKRVNICREEESKYLKSDKFKALVSGESIDVERKFGGAFEAKLTAKFIFATNEMPTFEGLNHGLLRRLFVIPFHRTITNKEKDVFLNDKIKFDELPGILAWALEGARRLSKNGFIFSRSVATDQSSEEFKKNFSSAVMFVSENYDEDVSSALPVDELYEDYKNWCSARGKKPMSYYHMQKDLRHVALLPAPKDPKWVGGQMKRVRYLKKKTDNWESSLERNTKINF